jgi:hypothetical protein
MAIEAKKRQVALDVSGREHIRIEGLHLAAASMRLEDSSHCTVDGCHFTHLSYFTRQYGIGQVEKGRNTISSGETGIHLCRDSRSTRSSGSRSSCEEQADGRGR